jgi:hypothetical protein
MPTQASTQVSAGPWGPQKRAKKEKEYKSKCEARKSLFVNIYFADTAVLAAFSGP